MKKWMYLIFPAAMLAIFLGFFLVHQKAADEIDRQRKEVLAKKAADEAATKKKNEEKARADAAQRQAEREKEEADREAARRAKSAAIDKEIRDQTNAALADGDKSQKEVNALEVELDRLHKEKDRLGREAFE